MTKAHPHDAFIIRFKFTDGTEWAVCRFAGCCYSVGEDKTNPVRKHTQSVEPVFDEAVDGVIDEPQGDVVVSELSAEQMSFTPVIDDGEGGLLDPPIDEQFEQEQEVTDEESELVGTSECD